MKRTIISAPRDPNILLVLSRAAQNQTRPPSLDKLFFALGNRHRRVIFEKLCHHEAQVDDLVELTSAPYQAIRKQLSVLEEAGLIMSYKDKNYRFFHAAPSALSMLQVWTETMARVIDDLS